LKKRNIYVSTVALIDWQGKVLISLRPGGKVKINESPHHAIIREIKEELTLDINKKSLKPLSFNTHTYEEFHAVIFFYICRSWNGTPLSKNKQKILWVEIDKLKNYNFLPGSIKFVLELNKLKKK
jgi:8-oxo-dGTP diphosphatase